MQSGVLHHHPETAQSAATNFAQNQHLKQAKKGALSPSNKGLADLTGRSGARKPSSRTTRTRLAEADDKFKAVLKGVPNLHDSVPVGKSADDNVEATLEYASQI
jgi:seryl-tRNA synthetase